MDIAVEVIPIGAVARRSGLRVSALRYYEEAGLIPPAKRIGRQRVYDESIFSSLALIRLAQEAGFTIAETHRLISGFDRKTPASARWRAMAHGKITDLTRRIEQARQMKRLLERLVQCECETLDQCVRSRAAALRSLR
ncbi:MAG TPA: MerR family transcriptional regulator [Gemmatimonadaceae bacterium]|jgi:MerR family redox-sensitive transcriptional activator SoxR